MARADVFTAPLVALPGQPGDVGWPTRSWPEGRPPVWRASSSTAFSTRRFDDTGTLAHTYAVVVVHGGRVVGERYGGLEPRGAPTAPVGPDTTLLSWSMAKSMV